MRTAILKEVGNKLREAGVQFDTISILKEEGGEVLVGVNLSPVHGIVYGKLHTSHPHPAVDYWKLMEAVTVPGVDRIVLWDRLYRRLDLSMGLYEQNTIPMMISQIMAMVDAGHEPTVSEIEKQVGKRTTEMSHQDLHRELSKLGVQEISRLYHISRGV